MIDFISSKCPVALLVVCAAWLCAGCERSVPVGNDETQVDAPVQRLSQAAGFSWRVLAANPLVIPLDDRWQAHRCRIDTTDEGLALTPESGPPALFLSHSIDLDLYTHLRIRMKASAGSYATLQWQGAYKPRFEDAPGATIPIFSDDAWRDYTFPLSQPEFGPWRGELTGLALYPTDRDAAVVIASVTFIAEPSEGPLRMTLGDCTREALYGRSLRWELTVPPRGVLEAAIGMVPVPGSVPNVDGVRFGIDLIQEGQRPVRLLTQALTPPAEGQPARWVDHEADLRSYAGQEVTLSFSIDNAANCAHDFAFWGDPLVYSRARTQSGTPIVLISCDTMRADHLSSYGYARKTTPHLDTFAQDAVLFEKAFCSEVWTPTSHMTMLTGLYPKNHGLTRFLNIAESIVTLPEVLRAGGYHTAGFVGHYWWMMPSRGFAHGFDLYDASHPYREVFQTLGRVHAWLEPRQHAPFFLFFHNYDLHSKEKGPLPYDPENSDFRAFAKDHKALPAFVREGLPDAKGSLFLAAHNARDLSVSAEEQEAIVNLYDDCLLKVDAAVGEFLGRLRAAGIYDCALIIITSDHGEALGEHDRYMHGDVYEANIHVPLLIKFPKQSFAGRRVAGMVELADLFPTVLDVLDIPLPNTVDGQSLLPLIDDAREPVSEVYSTRAAWRSIRMDNQKLIRNIEENTTERYAIATDPAESANLYEPGDPESANLTHRLDLFFQPRSEGWHIRFGNGGADWKARLTAETNDRIVSAQMLRGHMLEGNMGLSLSNRFEADIHLSKDTPEDTLLLRTANTNATVALSVSSDRPFSMGNSSELAASGTREWVLDPLDVRYAQAPPLPPGETATVTVWFVAPGAEGGAADTLTPEAQDELRALGYVD